MSNPSTSTEVTAELINTIDLNRRPALKDFLVDYDCHFLDGKCDCKAIYDCKYNGKEFSNKNEPPK